MRREPRGLALKRGVGELVCATTQASDSGPISAAWCASRAAAARSCGVRDWHFRW
jgi:hypothetical protein